MENAPRTHLPLPDKFEGGHGPHQSELWQKWVNRFERYRIASGLNIKGDREQVSTLLYSMGECADDIIVALSIKEETATYVEV